MEAQAQFLNLLKFAPYGDGENYCLIEEFIYQHKDGRIITVPALFITDGASVPRIFWNILPPLGKYTFAAVVHDWLYYDQFTTKEYADEVLLEGMKVMGVPEFSCGIIYEAVHKAGQNAWNENKEKKDLGFIRVAQSLPKTVHETAFYWTGATGDWKKG